MTPWIWTSYSIPERIFQCGASYFIILLLLTTWLLSPTPQVIAAAALVLLWLDAHNMHLQVSIS